MLGGPRGGGVLGDVDVHDAAAVVRHQDEDEEHAARQRRDGEEIHRDEGGEWLARKVRLMESRFGRVFAQHGHGAVWPAVELAP